MNDTFTTIDADTARDSYLESLADEREQKILRRNDLRDLAGRTKSRVIRRMALQSASRLTREIEKLDERLAPVEIGDELPF